MSVTVLEAAATIRGGTRTEELTVPGVLHDVCSAVHPMAAGSPFLQDFDIEWCWPDVDCAHPLDDGSAGVMLRSLDETAAGLGEDGRTWKWMFQPSKKFDALTADLFRPVLHVPKHPLQLMRFGLPAATPATLLAKKLRTAQARALFGGVAAHALAPLNKPMSSSVGMALTCACHAYGWPVARGGSKAITDALAADIATHGGAIATGVRVESLAQVQDAITVFDLAPSLVADIAGDRLPARVARAYR